jgi:endoglucanase
LDTIKTLSQFPGVSGDEGAVREVIADLVRPFAESVEADPLGNLVVFKRGRERPEKKLLLSAHMDEVGFIVTSITEVGLLRIASVGGIDSRVVLGKAVEVGGARVPGVIGAKAIHQASAAEQETPIAVDKLYIDIGATDHAQAEELDRKSVV